MRARARGFTLVEILVSLALTSVLAAALLAVAQVQAGLHRDQSSILAAQDNARAALNVLTHDIRLLGAPAWGWGVINSTGAGIPVLPMYQVVDGGPDAPDRLDLLIPTSEMVLLAAEAQSGAAQLSLLRLDPLSQQNPLTGQPANRDFVAGNLALLSNITALVPRGLPQSAFPAVAGCGAGSDGAGVALVRVVAPVARTFLSIQPLTTGGCRFDRGSVLLRASALSYHVQDDQLMVSDEALLSGDVGFLPPGAPVAERIVDLQVAIGIDGLSGARDGILTADEWVYGDPLRGGPMPTQPPSALRVTVVARSGSPGPQLGSGRPAVENRSGGAPDAYRYRLLSTTITPRNLSRAQGGL